MRAVDIIAAKRDGQQLTSEQIDFFIRGLSSGDIPEYQAAALLMAGFLRGFTVDEAAALTRSMTRSGAVLSWPGLSHVADKHSTGGVGDKTSLLVAPICAALGVQMPMISGRGLGHTGGTLDKLEAIPGMNVRLSLREFDAMVREHGLCFMGQTADIAPADGTLYALRDVTATVPHRALIASSILSKKCAEGIQALVMDVKTGSGAFMQSKLDALELARDLQDIGSAMGLSMRILVTDMNTPLGACAGNGLETAECLRLLHNPFDGAVYVRPDEGNKEDEGSERDKALHADLLGLSLELAAHTLVLSGRFDDLDTARGAARNVMENGQALKKFRAVVTAQGGDPTIVDDPALLPPARLAHTLRAEKDGYLLRTDALLCGQACVQLGAGRNRAEDAVDHSVGMVFRAKPGMRVQRGDGLVTLLANDETRLQAALPLVRKAVDIGPEPPDLPPLIHRVL